MPGDQVILRKVGKARIHYQLRHPNKNDKAKINYQFPGHPIQNWISTRVLAHQLNP